MLSSCGDDGKAEPHGEEGDVVDQDERDARRGRRSDATVADLITDGCNMGVKSLNRYLNRYAAADEKAKTVAKLIRLEEKLTQSAGHINSGKNGTCAVFSRPVLRCENEVYCLWTYCARFCAGIPMRLCAG